MPLLCWFFRSFVIILLTSAGSLTAVHAQTLLRESNCPTRSLEQIRSEHQSPAAPRGEELIDRQVFWRVMERVVKAKEIFKFTKAGRDGVVKEVAFDRRVLDSEHRTVIEAIFDFWEGTTPTHPKHLALMLGTAYRETCGLMSAGVGEACGCRKTCRAVELKGSRYGQADSCGRAYFGRSFVQLTHGYNYEEVGTRLGLPLRDYPDLAYDQGTAIRMLVQGVQEQWYAGKPLDYYLNDERDDWVGARNAVNPGSPKRPPPVT